MNTLQLTPTISDSEALTITTGGSFMKNYLSSLPVSPESQIMAVHDSQGFPIVFSFDAGSRFYVMQNKKNDPTGWEQIDLSASVSEFGKAVYFSVGQIDKGNLFLLVGIQGEDESAPIDLYIAGPLSNDLSVTDFKKLNQFWVKAATPVAASGIELAKVGPVDDGQGFGIPLIAMTLIPSQGSEELNYLLQASIDMDTGAISWKWLDFPSPTQASKVLDYAPGRIADFSLPGVYILYTGEDGHTYLVFKTLFNEYGRPLTRDLLSHDKQVTLQSTPGDNGSTYLFLGGGEGIDFFDEAAQLKDEDDSWKAARKIATGKQLPDIGKGDLIVRQNQLDPTRITLWALSKNNLYSFYRRILKGEAEWSKPLALKNSVAVMAPLLNDKNHANELVYLSTDWKKDKAIHYMWQDPLSSLWNEDSIPLYSTDEVTEVDSYSTRITFKLPNQVPVVGINLELSSASYQRILVNGIAASLDANTPLPVKTDSAGTINIVQPIQTLGISTYRLTSPVFKEPLMINPASDVYGRLAQVKKGSDIPIKLDLPNGISQDDFAEMLSEMMSFEPDDPYPTNAVNLDVPVNQKRVAPKIPTTSRCFALNVSAEGKVQFHRGAAAEKIFKSESFGSWVVDAVGDVIQFAWGVVKSAFSFVFNVVKGAIKITLKIAGQTIKFLIKTFPQLFAFISLVLKQLSVLLADVIHWLGELFGWEDIWRTHKVLAGMVKGAFSALNAVIPSDAAQQAEFKEKLKRKISAHIDGMKTQFATAEVPPEDTGFIPQQFSENSAKENPDANFDSPMAGWSAYQLQYSGMLNGGPIDTDPPGPLKAFIQDVLIPTAQTLACDLSEDLDNFVAIFTGKGATLDSIVTFLKGLADTIFDTIKHALEGFIDFLIDLIPWVESLLLEEMNIPFISGLYKWLTGALGESEPLTALNATSLMVAIPYTWLYKIFHHGKAPFEEEEKELLSAPKNALYLQHAYGARLAVVNGGADDDGGDDDAPTGYAKWAPIYSIYGAGVASISGFLASISGFFSFGMTSGQQASYGKWFKAASLGFGCLAMAGTVPLPSPNMKDAFSDNFAYGSKVFCWLSSGERIIANIILPKEPQIQGSVKAAFNAAIGISAILSDIIGGAPPPGWCNDVCSNVGGIIAGVSKALVQPEIAVFGSGVAYLGGNLVGLVTALLVDTRETIYLINMGG